MDQYREPIESEKEAPKLETTQDVVEGWFESQDQAKPKELTDDEKELKKQLQEKMEGVQFSAPVQQQASQDAVDLSAQTLEQKIKQLLNLAQTKSLEYSVDVAKKTNDPLLIDLYHDILAKDGYFQKFLKK